MFPRFERARRRLYVRLVRAERTGKTVRQHRLGSLGSIAFSEPIASEQIQFRLQLDARLSALAARHPEGNSPVCLAAFQPLAVQRLTWGTRPSFRS
jgi:hypothetical protein